MAVCPRCVSLRPQPVERCICTAPTSPRGSPREQTRCSLSVRNLAGRMASRFVAACRSASPGLETSETIRRRRRTDSSGPSHGSSMTSHSSGDDVTVTMSTGSDEGTKRWWPADFRLTYRATFGNELSLELELHNLGTAPLRFEEALHSYHRVGDVRMARLAGSGRNPLPRQDRRLPGKESNRVTS